MKYLSFTALFITLIFPSCQNKTQINSTTAKDSVVAKRNDSHVVDSPNVNTSPNQDASIFMIDTYRIYEGAEDPAKILNNEWFDLYEENGEFHLAKVNYKIEDGYNECAEIPTKTVISKRKSILFLNFPFLKAGKIESLKISQAEIWPKETIIYNFKDQKYQLKGYGDIIGTQVQSNEQGHEEIFHEVKNYKLTYSFNEGTEVPMFQTDQFHDTFIKTLFVGDIDRDGKLDFIFSNPTDYEENSIMLILSSQIKAQDIEKSKYEQNVQFDC